MDHIEAPPAEEVGATIVVLEVEASSVRVAAVLAQTLESVQEPTSLEATEVVDVYDSPVKSPLKPGERKEVILVGETAAEKKLVPGKILLKDEEIEQLLPRFGIPSAECMKKTPLKICGLAPFGTSIPPSEKKRKSLFPSFFPVNLRNDEEKEEKGRKEEGSKMEEATKGKKEVSS
ncbi:hypothetical protein AXF42_Ash007173 [Apostasia shenzhenica]|uniref:Uncharacterized protein n=1 Tax=Apostasia shenzhenica TaxID=1088818 RepID=A0A2I0B9E5_9ASPA|nr:hypothetical protein AXF42_Ash007173 [Apostasia shenzhenica]